MQNKKKLLKELYYGNISPQARPIEPNSDYRKLQEQLSDLADSFHKKLNVEDKKILDDIMTTWSNMSDTNGAESFSIGFKMGVKLILEIFEKDDELLDQIEV